LPDSTRAARSSTKNPAGRNFRAFSIPFCAGVPIGLAGDHNVQKQGGHTGIRKMRRDPRPHGSGAEYGHSSDVQHRTPDYTGRPGRFYRAQPLTVPSRCWFVLYSKSQMIPKLICFTALIASSLFAADIPRPSPDFVIQLTGGKQVKVSDYRGKVLCLVFILTT
jgi:hypothetical protein